MEDAFESLNRTVHRVLAVRHQSDGASVAGLDTTAVRAPRPRFTRPSSVTSVSGVMRNLTDEALTQTLWQLGELRRQVDALTAVVAGEVASRSRRPVGGATIGLAQKNGYRAPSAMVQAVTGSSRDDAVRFVQVGEVITDAEQAIDARASVDELGLVDDNGAPVDIEGPWLAPVGLAVVSQGLSVATAHAMMRGLAEPNGVVRSAILEDAAARLAAESVGASPDEVYRRARMVRRRLEGDLELFEPDAAVCGSR